MRRIMVLVSALLIAVVVASPVAAASETFHFRFQGRGVEAFWTTAPPDAAPAPGSTVTEIYMSASRNAIDENGTAYNDAFVFIDMAVYKIDRRGNWQLQSLTVFDASGDALALAVDRKLTTATVTATLNVYPCRSVQDGWTCESSGATVELDASFAGIGPLYRSSGHNTSTGGGSTYVSSNKGTGREASGTATLDGASLGSPAWAYIYDSTWRDIFISH